MATTILNKTKAQANTIEQVIGLGTSPDADYNRILKSLQKCEEKISNQFWNCHFTQQAFTQARRAIETPDSNPELALENHAMMKAKAQETNKRYNELLAEKAELRKEWEAHPFNVRQRELNSERKPTQVFRRF